MQYAAPTPVASSQAAGVAAASTVTVATPTGVQVGDLMVAYVGINSGTSQTMTPPTGWTEYQRTVGNSVNGIVYYKFADSTDAAGTTYTWTAGGASLTVLVGVAAYRDCQFGPLLYSGGTFTASTTPAARAITPDRPNCMIVAGFVTAGAAGSSWTPNAAETERADVASATVAISLELVDFVWNQALATPAYTSTHTSSTAGVAMTLALYPKRSAGTALTLIDDFNRADGAFGNGTNYLAAAGSWLALGGVANAQWWSILSNTLKVNEPGSATAIYWPDTDDGGTVQAQFDVVAKPNTTDGSGQLGFLLKGSNVSATSYNAYLLRALRPSNNYDAFEILRVVSGSATTLKKVYGPTWAVGDTLVATAFPNGLLRLEKISSGVRSLLAEVVDTNGSLTGNYFGILGSTGQVDNFKVSLPSSERTLRAVENTGWYGPPPTFQLLDNFNRADEAPLTGVQNEWTAGSLVGAANPLILSGNTAVHGSTFSTFSGSNWNRFTFGDRQVQARIVTAPTTGADAVYLILADQSTSTGYYVKATTTALLLFKDTTQQATVSYTPAAGDVIRAAAAIVNGQMTITAWVQAGGSGPFVQKLQWTEATATYPTGVIGIAINDAGGHPALDDFWGGSLDLEPERALRTVENVGLATAFPTGLTLLDDFNRADETPNVGPAGRPIWIAGQTNGNTGKVVSNKWANTSTLSHTLWGQQKFTDCYVQGTVRLSGAGKTPILLLRGDGNAHWYRCYVQSGSTSAFIGKDNLAATSFATSYSVADGDVLRASAVTNGDGSVTVTLSAQVGGVGAFTQLGTVTYSGADAYLDGYVGMNFTGGDASNGFDDISVAQLYVPPKRGFRTLENISPTLAVAARALRSVDTIVNRFRSSNGTNTTLATTSFQITAPSWIVAGDVLVAMISKSYATGDPDPTPPTGWTQLDKIQDAANTRGHFLYWKLATGSEPANYTWTGTYNGGGPAWVGTIVCYRGDNNPAPIGNVAHNGPNASGATLTGPTITPDTDGEAGISIGISQGNHTFSTSSPNIEDAQNPNTICSYGFIERQQLFTGTNWSPVQTANSSAIWWSFSFTLSPLAGIEPPVIAFTSTLTMSEAISSAVPVADTLTLVQNPAGLLDDFNRPNESPLSHRGDWVTPTGNLPLRLLSNVVATTGTTFLNNYVARWDSTVFEANQEVTVKIAQKATGQHESARLWARLGSGAYYYCAFYTGQGVVYLASVVNGVATDLLGGYLAFTVSVGDVLGLRCQGNQISVTRNGTAVYTVTNSSVKGPGKVQIGILLEQTGDVGDTRIDDFTVIGAPTYLSLREAEADATPQVTQTISDSLQDLVAVQTDTLTIVQGAKPFGYVGSSSADGTGATLTISRPAGVQDGDVLLALGIQSDGTALQMNFTPPAGWTKLDDSGGKFSGTGTWAAVYVKKADDEPASYSWSYGGSGAAARGLVIAAYRGVKYPVAMQHGMTAPAFQTSQATPTVTTTAANELLVGLFAMDASQAMAPGDVGDTERVDMGLGGGRAEIVDRTVAAAGSSASVSTTTGSNRWINSFLVALEPLLDFTISDSVSLIDTLLIDDDYQAASGVLGGMVFGGTQGFRLGGTWSKLAVDEVIQSGGPPATITDDLYDSFTNAAAVVEAIAEPLLLVSEQVDDSGTVAELGDTLLVQQQLTDAITAESILEYVRNVATAALSFSETGGESEPIIVSQRESLTLLEEVQGSITETLTLVETMVLSLTNEIIRSDIETLTLSEQMTFTLDEETDILTVTSTGSLSLLEFIPQTIDTLTLTETATLRISDDSEVVKLSQTGSPSINDLTELAKLTQRNVVSLLQIIDTPGQGRTDYIQLTQTALLRLVETVIQYGPDHPRLVMTNVPSLIERIRSLATNANTNGIEFTLIQIPYSQTSFTLAADVAAGDTTITLSSATGLPDASSPYGYVLLIGDEYVLVTGRVGNTLTVTRGWSLTTAAAHLTGVTVTWPNFYDMSMSATSATAAAGYWLTMFDATQAYLDGDRYAWHVGQLVSIGPQGGSSKLDGPQPGRAFSVTGLTNEVPAGVCQPARMTSALANGDRITVRYYCPEPSGTFVVGPRMLLYQTWAGVDSNTMTGNSFIRVDSADNLDILNPNGLIWDGSATLSTTAEGSTATLNAEQLASSRLWTKPLPMPGGGGRSGIELGVVVCRNGFSDVPDWSSSTFTDGRWQYMGFVDEDCMFMQVVYRYHPTPDTDNHFGPAATWNPTGWNVATPFDSATAWAMFLIPDQTIYVPPGPGGGSGGGTGDTGSGGGIGHPPIARRVHIRHRH